MATTCKLIAKTTLGSSAANIEFTSIPSTYTDLLLVCSVRSDRASNAVDNVKIRFNGAANDNNLSVRYLYGDGASATSFTLSSFAYIGNAPASTATSNTFSSNECYIPNYAGSTNKSFSATGVQETNGTTAYIDAIAGLWSDTSAITAVRIFPANGSNFVTNSSAFLYGITKA